MAPLVVQRSAKARLGGSAIPVFRIELIAFFAVQVGMNPRAVSILTGLRCFVRAIPIPCGIALQRSLWTRQGRGIGALEWVRHVSSMPHIEQALRSIDKCPSCS